MTDLNKYDQLSTFSMIKGILTSESRLDRFNSNSYYEFEPKVKAMDFNGYPYIVIRVPESEDDQEFLGNVSEDKTFNINITMVVDYSARSNVAGYAAAMLASLRAATSTYRSSGYSYENVEMISPPEPTTIQQKDVVIVDLELGLRGEVKV